MLVYFFIIVTIIMSFHRGRHREPFRKSFAIEAGFLAVWLHYGFASDAFPRAMTYPSFLVQWVAPVVAACLIADGLGRLVARWL